MAANHLLIDTRAHIINRELACIGCNLTLEHNLQHHIAELFAQMIYVVGLDSVKGLVRFLYQVTGDGRMRLRPIPRATPVGRPQLGNGVDEVVKGWMLCLVHD